MGLGRDIFLHLHRTHVTGELSLFAVASTYIKQRTHVEDGEIAFHTRVQFPPCPPKKAAGVRKGPGGFLFYIENSAPPELTFFIIYL